MPNLKKKKKLIVDFDKIASDWVCLKDKKK